MLSLSQESEGDVPLNTDKFDYDFFPLEGFPTQIKLSFDRLVEDRYLKSNFQYRSRRYGYGRLCQGVFSFQDSQTFLQNKNVNSLIGGVSRKFEPLEKEVKAYLKREIIEVHYAKRVDPNKKYSVGIHQIRVTANQECMGLPAPEGIHQDGFDFVSILVVSLENVCGAKNLLLDVKDRKRVLYEAYLPEDTVFIFNDRTFSHYVSPVTPMVPGEAKRDIFVITLAEEGREG